MELKTCSKCGQDKSTIEFCKDSYKKSGLASWCKSCQSSRAKTWWTNHRELILPRLREVAPVKRIEQKIRVLTHYGNGKPACIKCGENDLRCLSIDHINNDGSVHRKSSTIVQSNIYYWLEKNGYPEGYQTLCMNCQFKKYLFREV